MRPYRSIRRAALESTDQEAVPSARRRRRVRRLASATLLLLAIAGLWLSRDRWLPAALPSNPYQSTPAENFPVGAAGFVPPPAHPVDQMDAPAVAAALNRVRDALIASYLDPRVLVEHDPTPLLRLLAPDSAAVVGPRLAAGEYGTAVVRLRPDATLAGTPRVSGRMDFRRVDWSGLPALDVTSNYVVVYAFTGSAKVVVVHAETHWLFPVNTASLRPSSVGMYLDRTTGYWHGMDCAAAREGLTAPALNPEAGAKPNSGGPDSLDAFFDPNKPITAGSDCP